MLLVPEGLAKLNETGVEVVDLVAGLPPKIIPLPPVACCVA